MEPLKIKIKKIHPEAQIPLITQGNACFDFYAIEDTAVKSMHLSTATFVRTGLSYEGFFMPFYFPIFIKMC